jgi:hypothetical protein
MYIIIQYSFCPIWYQFSLPSWQEGIADCEVSLQRERDGAVDAAHESDLRDGDHHRLRRDYKQLVVVGPEDVQRKEVDRAGNVYLKEKKTKSISVNFNGSFM